MITPTILKSPVKFMVSMVALRHILLTFPDLELGPSDERRPVMLSGSGLLPSTQYFLAASI